MLSQPRMMDLQNNQHLFQFYCCILHLPKCQKWKCKTNWKDMERYKVDYRRKSLWVSQLIKVFFDRPKVLFDWEVLSIKNWGDSLDVILWSISFYSSTDGFLCDAFITRQHRDSRHTRVDHHLIIQFFNIMVLHPNLILSWNVINKNLFILNNGMWPWYVFLILE